MVFVSRLAGPPHFGHVTFTQSVMPARGDSPVPVGWKVFTSGSFKGSSE